MAVMGIGMDLVTISEFAEQMERPGTQMRVNFTAGERRDVQSKPTEPTRHYAARWAAKEAVLKAWSGSRFAKELVVPSVPPQDIEVVLDAWGRPNVRLHGDIGKALAGARIHISLTHDGDVAGAFAVIETE